MRSAYPLDQYLEARAEAQRKANLYQMDYGVEKLGREYIVRPLPRPEHCYGIDLRPERVRPEVENA